MRHLLLTAGMIAMLLGTAQAKEEPAKTEKATAPAVTAAPAVPAPAPAPKAAEPAAAAVDPAKVVVTVNDQKVTEGEVTAELNKRLDVMKQRMGGQDIPEQQKLMMRTRVVDMKVEQILLDQQLKKEKLTITDEKVDAELKKIAGQEGQSMEEVEKQVKAMGMTMDDVKSQIRYKLVQETLLEANMKDGVKPEDIKKFYDENPQHFDRPEQVQASHILVKVEKDASEETKAAAKKKIEDILKKAKAEGADFAALAKENSECPSAANGGDLGLFGRGQMVKEFEDTAFGMKTGEISGVVETQFGYHIIKLTDKKEAGKVPFDEVKEQIEGYLKQNKQREFWDGYSKSMHDSAKIEFSAEEQAARDKAQAAMQQQQQQMQIMPQTAPAQPAEEKKADDKKPEEKKDEKK